MYCKMRCDVPLRAQVLLCAKVLLPTAADEDRAGADVPRMLRNLRERYGAADPDEKSRIRGRAWLNPHLEPLRQHNPEVTMQVCVSETPLGGKRTV